MTDRYLSRNIINITIVHATAEKHKPYLSYTVLCSAYPMYHRSQDSAILISQQSQPQIMQQHSLINGTRRTKLT